MIPNRTLFFPLAEYATSIQKTGSCSHILHAETPVHVCTQTHKLKWKLRGLLINFFVVKEG